MNTQRGNTYSSHGLSAHCHDSHDELRDRQCRCQGTVSRSPGNLPGPISIFFKYFFADYTVIIDMVLSQCFHTITRFLNLVNKANNN